MYVKRTLIALALLCTLTAHAQDNTDQALQRAYIGQAADVGTTAFGILSGAGYEANPLGFPGVLVVKAVALNIIDKQAEPVRTRNLTILEAFGWGAAANNVLGLLSVAAGPAAVVGIGVGALLYKHRQPERDEAVRRADFELLCAQFLAGGVARSCEYRK